MNLDPMDQPDPADQGKATSRGLLTEMLDVVDAHIAQSRDHAKADADRRTRDVDFALIDQMRSDPETWKYIASRCAELYLETVIMPKLQKIRVSTMATCDLADMLTDASRKAAEEGE